MVCNRSVLCSRREDYKAITIVELARVRGGRYTFPLLKNVEHSIPTFFINVLFGLYILNSRILYICLFSIILGCSMVDFLKHSHCVIIHS